MEKSRSRALQRYPLIKIGVVLVLLIALVCLYYGSAQDIQLISLTTNVRPGNMARIVIQGHPETVYDISVRYMSGPSKASGLYPKESDANGYVSWSWLVGTRTTKGTWPITIKGGRRALRTSFTVR